MTKPVRTSSSMKSERDKSPKYRVFLVVVTPRGIEANTLLGYTIKLQEIFQIQEDASLLYSEAYLGRPL